MTSDLLDAAAAGCTVTAALAVADRRTILAAVRAGTVRIDDRGVPLDILDVDWAVSHSSPGQRSHDLTVHLAGAQ